MDTQSSDIPVFGDKFQEYVDRLVKEKCGEAVAEVFVEEFGEVICETIEKLLIPVAEMEAMRRKEYLTEKEVSLLYSISPDSLRTERSRGLGPGYVKDGKRVLYPKRELVTYFERRLTKTRG